MAHDARFMTNSIQVPNAPDKVHAPRVGQDEEAHMATHAMVTMGVKRTNRGNLVFRAAATYAIQAEATMTARGPGV